ncbi:MAG: hypothetical protein HQK92_09460 [Nitrospirae bacterium]|nr:hypothetical protein [Nitrospirota bacterium]
MEIKRRLSHVTTIKIIIPDTSTTPGEPQFPNEISLYDETADRIFPAAAAID